MAKPQGLLSRQQFADRCQLSIAEIRRRETVGMLVPICRDKSRAYYTPSQVDEQIHLTRRPKSEYAPGDGKRIFEALERGLTPVQVVVELEVHPRVVSLALEDWAKLRGGFQVSASFVETLEKILPDGSFPPVKDERAILDIVRILVTEMRQELACRCGKTKQTCLSCARTEVVKQINKQVQKAKKEAERTRKQAIEDEDYEAAAVLTREVGE